MPYAIVSDSTIVEYPVNLSDRLPNTSMREQWPGGIVNGVEYVVVWPTTQPDHEPETQNLVEGTPALSWGIWCQQWTVEDASPTEIAERREAKREVMTCTPRQIRLALAGAGLLPMVEAMVSGLDPMAKIEWEYASEIRRTNALLTSAASALGMTDAQVDALFAQAAEL